MPMLRAVPQAVVVAVALAAGFGSASASAQEGAIVLPPLEMPQAAPGIGPAPAEANSAPSPAPNMPLTAPVVQSAPPPGLAIAAEVSERLKRPAAGASVAEKEDRAALAAFYSANPDLVLWAGAAGLSSRGTAVLTEIAAADDWGLRARDFDLPTAKVGADAADAEVRISLAVLKYARHARGGRFDPLDLSDYLDRKGNVLPPRAVLDGIAAAADPAAYLRGLHPAHPQFERLRQKLQALKAGVPATAEPATKAEPPTEAAEPKPTKKGQKQATKKEPEAAKPPAVTQKKLIANMEMWRWMPLDLGARHIFVNVPEFTFRYMKDGRAIHTERVITGKPDTQTPIFSDEMEHVIFHPTWNVPDSIKVKEILPSLARGGNILERQGLRVNYGNRPIDPHSVDWRRVDIRSVHVYQPSGPGNALGLMKFMFPNKHHVYLHDTPTKPLFNSAARAFSHGCVRVRNPQRFAEVLFQEDRGWGPEKIKSLLDVKQENNQVNLTTRIPVHVSYFTAWVDDDGNVQSWRDIYAYEDKIHLGIDGKAHTIVKKKDDLGQIRADVVGRLSENNITSPADLFRWMGGLFGN